MKIVCITSFLLGFAVAYSVANINKKAVAQECAPAQIYFDAFVQEKK